MSLSGAEIREKFISYFRDKHKHLHLPSASLIPDNPTLLLTSAGMVPFVPYFLGQAPPPRTRIVTCQKSARAGGKDSDIENIGRTARHHSFFEMLGNFSFGDYFKKEVIPWAFEFVTKDLGLDAERISVTVFEGDEYVQADEESYDIWHKIVGIPKDKIQRLSRRDNFWGPPGPTGPCGPCTELYYDRGPDLIGPALAEAEAKQDRYIEIWNLVLMELFDESGKYVPLVSKNVDTGAGLERLATVLQKKSNSFETDLLFPILEAISKLSGVKYGANLNSDIYLKIITDHARCVTFLVTDGIRTSNLGRGYVLRFIIRRAARFGRLLGLTEPFIYKLVPVVINLYSKTYPELAHLAEFTEKAIRAEEERFAKTIDRGIVYLNELLVKPDKALNGTEAFNLYATYGFPIELTSEIAHEQGKKVDMEGFVKAQQEHEEVSSVNKFNVILTGQDALGEILRKHGTTKFTGYEHLEDTGNILAIVKAGKLAKHAQEGEEVELILDQTPFYGESGGQNGDQGVMKNDQSSLEVLDTKKHEGLHVHKVRLISGEIESGQNIKEIVDKNKRQSIVAHHSTAHLFHAAIRQILGNHVVQAGQMVNPDVMRFDFSFERQVSPQELKQVEELINEWIRQDLPVTASEMPLADAKKTGAIAMFGEKYGDIVRVISMNGVSLEFCGGTHVSHTGEIGPVKIITESSIASGVRRVEALAGVRAWHFINEQTDIISALSNKLKVKPLELTAYIDKLQELLKVKEKEALALEEKLALAQVAPLLSKAENLGSLRFVSGTLKNISTDTTKFLADHLRKQDNNIFVILGSVFASDKLNLVVGISDALITNKNGLHAGQLVKVAATICGGTGGGRTELASAGGKDPSKLEEAFQTVKALLKEGSFK